MAGSNRVVFTLHILSQLAVASDQSVGRAIVRELRLCFGLEFGDDSLGKDLSQFDSPLVEGVDLPDGALGKDAVLVKCNEFPQRRRVNRSTRIVLDGRLPSKVR